MPQLLQSQKMGLGQDQGVGGQHQGEHIIELKGNVFKRIDPNELSNSKEPTVQSRRGAVDPLCFDVPSGSVLNITRLTASRRLVLTRSPAWTGSATAPPRCSLPSVPRLLISR
jgi:hypothetical protein